MKYKFFDKSHLLFFFFLFGCTNNPDPSSHLEASQPSVLKESSRIVDLKKKNELSIEVETEVQALLKIAYDLKNQKIKWYEAHKKIEKRGYKPEAFESPLGDITIEGRSVVHGLRYLYVKIQGGETLSVFSFEMEPSLHKFFTPFSKQVLKRSPSELKLCKFSKEKYVSYQDSVHSVSVRKLTQKDLSSEEGLFKPRSRQDLKSVELNMFVFNEHMKPEKCSTAD